jgi:hypothetical protein
MITSLISEIIQDHNLNQITKTLMSPNSEANDLNDQGKDVDYCLHDISVPHQIMDMFQSALPHLYS